MGPVGVQEMIVIFLVALVLFGPKKLPELGRTIGKAITEFRRAQSELKTTLQSHMKELEKETESLKEVTRTYTDEIYNHYDSITNQQYDSPYHDSGSYGSYDYNSQPAESNPSTVGATAIQGAESNASHEATANGTVPRTTTSESGNVLAEHHAEEQKVPEHAAAGTDGQTKPEAAVS
jgi:sec-independent protein translocase protein TatA